MQTSKPRDLYIGSAWGGGGITKISHSGEVARPKVEEFHQEPDPYVPPSYGDGTAGAFRRLF
jgi:hypothetical protein